MIRLVAIDIDGTLLDGQNQIPEENIQELRRIQEKGVEIALATGRIREMMGDILDKLGMEVHLVSANGTLVEKAGDKDPILDKVISLEVGREVLEVLSRLDRYYYTYAKDGTIIGDSKTFSRRGHTTLPHIVVDDMADYMEKTGKLARKICSMGAPQELLDLQSNLLRKWGDHLVTYIGGHGGLEIGPAGTSKRIAVKRLAESFGFKMAEVMALGDADNDMDLVKGVGVGVAMGNAVGSLKKVADFVTKTNDEAGLAHAIRQLIP